MVNRRDSIVFAKPCFKTPAIFFFLIALSLPLNKNTHAVEDGFPFSPGEKLTFELRWTVIPAGEAVLEVLPMETIDGTQVYHFAMSARSNSFVDNFYMVRDRIDAFAAMGMDRSVLY